MKQIFLCIALLSSVLFCRAEIVSLEGAKELVPTASSYRPGKGTLTWPAAQVTFTYDDERVSRGADYCCFLMTSLAHATQAKKAGTIHFQYNKKLGTEAYILSVTPQGVVIQASALQGSMWAAQSLMQLLSQHNGSLNCGTYTDEPAYPIRGFMLDCGRKYIPLDYLRSLVRTMSYYKLNTLQIHLNDNGFKKYANDDWNQTYAGFRIQSDYFPGLTSQDGYYTKDEFRQFIREAAQFGVEIIPEFDAPAHSLAFTHYRPSLACEEYGMDHLDLRNPAVVPFLDSLYQEYLGGPDPVFCCPRVHIGTDEYSNKDPEVVELFRSLTDHLIKTVESYGKQAVLWGALTHANGKTPVKSDNVLMDIWYNGYADPHAMHDQGYQMISIPDGMVYIVPEAGYYYNYLNCQYLYEHWTPAQIGDQLFDAHDPQIKGGMFALWNDVTGNGISVGDIQDRVFPALQVISEKTWHAVNDTIGYAQWDAHRKTLGEAPGENELGTTEVTESVLMPNTKISQQALAQIGYDYQVDFDITWANEDMGAILTAGPRARVYLSDPIGGWLGFSRDGYLFTFDYKGRVGQRDHITIQGTNHSTSLTVNGKLVQTLDYDKRLAADAKPYRIIRTLVFPLNYTGDFHSTVTNFSAKKL